MALSCIVISPEREVPPRISSFLNHARFFVSAGLFATTKAALEVHAQIPSQFILIELSMAVQVLQELKLSCTANLPKLIIFGPEESYFVESDVGDPSIFENPNLIPKLKGNWEQSFTAHIPQKIKIPNSSKLNFDIVKAEKKPVWMLLRPGDWSYELTHNAQNAIYVRSEGDIRRVRLSELLVIEAQKDYLKLSTPNESFRILKSMKKMEKFLNPKIHGRIHRSYIVLLNAIHTIDNDHVWLDGVENPIPIGPSYRKDLLASLEIL